MILSYLFATLSAFFESMKEVFSKKGLKDVDEYIITWAFGFFALPFLALPLVFFKTPNLGSAFWLALIIGGILNLLATVFHMKSIKKSDLSVTVPLMAFTPLFLLITAPLIIGEYPTLLGIIGVVLIVIGSYVLNFNDKEKGYLTPFKAMLEEHGPRLMLVAAFLLSLSSTVDKIGVLNSSPIFWAFSVHIFTTLTLAPILLYEIENHLKISSTELKILISIGIFSALSIIFQMTAISLTLVAYVIAIKRTSIVISVLLGHFIFKEIDIKERLLGASIMIIGVILITLS
ncbi:EamA family transporter [Methanobacterium oryzae]|uniref:EamA family transporter n=1 Tax=Methanobacterium oryzae TaxID=69540 RepID=UPI003D1B3826